MADLSTIQELLENEIKDLYSAQKQLLKAIPKMAKGANHPDLQNCFTAHRAETKEQVARLEEVAKLLEIKPTGKTRMGMEGVIKEGVEALEETGDDTAFDLGIIGAGSRVEHYEMAGYTTAIDLASQMKSTAVVALPQKSLGEEKAAEQKLHMMASMLMKSTAAAA